MAQQDLLTRIKERHDEAADVMREQHARMTEDAQFSNPAEPKQWPDEAVAARKSRPMLTADKTNQFISQVVNDMRQNKPQILCMPADSYADVAVAQKLNGIVRHIEYVSRAGIAYDTAAENQVRLGLGWLRVIPQVMRPETNEQEIRIMRIHDPKSCLLDPNSTEPDGSDAMWGDIATTLTHRAFKAAYPKAKCQSFDDESSSWFGDDSVRIVEYFEVVEEVENRIQIVAPDGSTMAVGEQDYWSLSKQIGYQPQVAGNVEARKRTVKWVKASGADILEETVFPSQYLPLIPVMGHEMWVEGKRYLCGMVRRMRDSQRLHNYVLSAMAESIALQPKAPYLAAAESVEGHEAVWKNANNSSAAYLPFNAFNESGEPIPAPQRSQPPVFSQGWAELLGYSSSSMEASVGMYAANLGKQSNETSGRAIRARQQEGDTANFHFADNQSRSIEQLGRVIVDMIPRIYDTARQARILGEDGEQEFVRIDPNMQQAVRKQGNKVVAINPNVGAYDVRVKTGPSYTTQRQETSAQLTELIRGNPQMLTMIGDMWAKLQDWPDSDKLARRLKAMLPPQVQQAEDDESDMPPEAMQKIQALQQQIQQLSQALENAAAEAEDKSMEKEKAEADMLIRGYEAVTKRLSAVPPITPEQVQAITLQTLQQALSVPPVDPSEMRGPEPPEPDEMGGLPVEQPMNPNQPPEGGFSLPEEETE